jgi:hypothetical protein
MKKKLTLTIITFVLIGLSSYYYVMYGGARDLSTEETAFTVMATAITAEFNTKLESSNKKYLEKPIAISGKVTSIKDTEVTLDNTVICTLIKKETSIKNNQSIILKGRVVGYDDLMGEVKLDQCFIVNK